MSVRVWRTEDELEYVNGLGRWSRRPGARLALLHGYRRTAAKRDHWGRIQPEAVLSAVDALIAEEGARIARTTMQDAPGHHTLVMPQGGQSPRSAR